MNATMGWVLSRDFSGILNRELTYFLTLLNIIIYRVDFRGGTVVTRGNVLRRLSLTFWDILTCIHRFWKKLTVSKEISNLKTFFCMPIEPVPLKDQKTLTKLTNWGKSTRNIRNRTKLLEGDSNMAVQVLTMIIKKIFSFLNHFSYFLI